MGLVIGRTRGSKMVIGLSDLGGGGSTFTIAERRVPDPIYSQHATHNFTLDNHQPLCYTTHMTAEEFKRQFVGDQLSKWFDKEFTVLPCSCDQEGCQGWIAISRKETACLEIKR